VGDYTNSGHGLGRQPKKGVGGGCAVLATASTAGPCTGLKRAAPRSGWLASAYL